MILNLREMKTSFACTWACPLYEPVWIVHQTVGREIGNKAEKNISTSKIDFDVKRVVIAL